MLQQRLRRVAQPSAEMRPHSETRFYVSTARRALKRDASLNSGK